MDYKEKYLKYSTDNNKKNKDYYLKYQKYKKKYLELKRNLLGSNNNIYTKKSLYPRFNKKNEYEDGSIFNIKKSKFFDIVDKLQTTKEENIRYKLVIQNQKNEINDIKNKLKEMRDIYMLNEKLTIMDMENGYGKLY
tara:strand:- start:861 stop:1271 length:411 start_codon:yes stop_codon:yes gene_type:complete